jgi:hypothetical protein
MHAAERCAQVTALRRVLTVGAARSERPDQHGRQGGLARQRLRRAPVVDREVPRGLPACLCQRPGYLCLTRKIPRLLAACQPLTEKHRIRSTSTRQRQSRRPRNYGWNPLIANPGLFRQPGPALSAGFLQYGRLEKSERSMRLVVLICASGSGKTTIVREIERRFVHEIQTFHFDDIGVPSVDEMTDEYGSGEEWQRVKTIEWMKRFADLNYWGRKLLFEGQTRLSFLDEGARAAGNFIYSPVLIDCDDATRARHTTKTALSSTPQTTC